MMIFWFDAAADARHMLFCRCYISAAMIRFSHYATLIFALMPFSRHYRFITARDAAMLLPHRLPCLITDADYARLRLSPRLLAFAAHACFRLRRLPSRHHAHAHAHHHFSLPLDLCWRHAITFSLLRRRRHAA